MESPVPNAALSPAEFGLLPSPSFLPDSRILVAASVDRPRALVHRWDTRPDHWIDSACKIAGRNLTEDEWRDAFDERPYRETCP